MILINNTVLSNFALAQAIPLLNEFCAGRGRITPQVVAEFEEGVEQGILPITPLGWLKRVRLSGHICGTNLEDSGNAGRWGRIITASQMKELGNSVIQLIGGLPRDESIQLIKRRDLRPSMPCRGVSKPGCRRDTPRWSSGSAGTLSRPPRQGRLQLLLCVQRQRWLPRGSPLSFRGQPTPTRFWGDWRTITWRSSVCPRKKN